MECEAHSFISCYDWIMESFKCVTETFYLIILWSRGGGGGGYSSIVFGPGQFSLSPFSISANLANLGALMLGFLTVQAIMSGC